jgi:hypothetical protein
MKIIKKARIKNMIVNFLSSFSISFSNLASIFSNFASMIAKSAFVANSFVSSSLSSSFF